MASNEGNERREEEYIEEEDEDFNPENQQDQDLSDSDDEDGHREKKKQRLSKDDDFDLDTEKEVKSANYSKIESEEGGLIKTRTQRALEIQQEKQYKSVLNSKSSVDVEEAWKRLKEESAHRLKHRYGSSSSTSSQVSQPLVANEKIKVKRTYEYAGEIITEERWVNRDSAEAKSYLSSLKEDEKVESSNDIAETVDNVSRKKSVNEDGKKLRIVRKRPPLLEGIINGSIKPKFNTLQKSKVDFAKLVDKEGINDELVHNTKDGYLERQDFLSRVQFHRDTQIKEIRRKELQNKNNS